MAVRPIRSATISFGLVAIPVKFYTATSQEDVSFNLLHEPCGTKVNRKWWCSHHEQIIESDELIRGYQIRKGKFVTFTDEEIEALETDDNRALEITEFLDLDQIDPLFFEKAYYLGPAEGGSKTYHLLSSAMKKLNKVAIAHWISARKEHLVILRPYEGGMILHTMYYADEVRDFSEIGVDDAPVKEKEIRLAEMLIEELSEDSFDLLRYKDEYRARLLARIEAKAEGEDIISAPEVEEDRGGEVIDIMEALRRSLEGSKPAARRAAAAAPAKTKKKAAKTVSAKSAKTATTARRRRAS